MCEAFNKCILELRGKPIINLVEWIKVYLMMRIVRMREMMLEYCGPIYPKIQLILANIEKDAKAWTLTLCGDIII